MHGILAANVDVEGPLVLLVVALVAGVVVLAINLGRGDKPKSPPPAPPQPTQQRIPVARLPEDKPAKPRRRSP